MLCSHHHPGKWEEIERHHEKASSYLILVSVGAVIVSVACCFLNVVDGEAMKNPCVAMRNNPDVVP